jgi:hypothetical protein
MIIDFYFSESQTFVQTNTGRFEQRLFDRQTGCQMSVWPTARHALGQLTRRKQVIERPCRVICGIPYARNLHDIDTKRLRQGLSSRLGVRCY